MRSLSRYLPLAFSFVLTAGSGRGQELRLSDLIGDALRSNPEILVAQKGLEAARKRPDQASALPETMLSLGYASNGAPWPGAGLGTDPTSNIGVMLTQEFPFPGKRKLRGDVAAKEAQAELEQYRAAQLTVVSRLKQAYYRLAYADTASDVIKRSRELLIRLLRITEARYAVGKAMQQDAFKAQTQLSILETKLIQLNRESAARRAEILSLVNKSPNGELRGIALLRKPQPLVEALEDLYAAANAMAPMLQRDKRMIERNQLALNLARKELYPDYALSAGYFNQGSMAPMYQFRVDFKLPTSAFRKQHAAIAEQVALVSQARHGREASSQNLSFRLKDEYLLYETSLRLAELYEKTIIPQSSLALESSLASYENGAVDFLSVLTNFLAICDYEMNYHEEAMNANLAIVRLEEMTGKPLGGGQQ